MGPWYTKYPVIRSRNSPSRASKSFINGIISKNIIKSSICSVFLVEKFAKTVKLIVLATNLPISLQNNVQTGIKAYV